MRKLLAVFFLWLTLVAFSGSFGLENKNFFAIVFLCFSFATFAWIAKPEQKKFEEQLKLAVKGDATAQYNVGMNYRDGTEGKQDYKEALNWFQKAAKQGHIEAQTSIGVMLKLISVKLISVKYIINFSEQFKLAEQGNAEAQSIVSLVRDEVGTKDSKEALNLSLKLAKRGDAGAQSLVCKMYYLGACVSQDYSEAIKWYLLAAEQGYAEAQYLVGWMYMWGKGVSQDSKKAY